MANPFLALRADYTASLQRMRITRSGEVNETARRLIAIINTGRYDKACAATGVPKIVAAASFEREAGSDFALSPAQGDRWDRRSVHVPRGRGPYASWTAAAIDAYQIDGLDKVGASNWSWERACYEEELFNGFGYRARSVHSPYLWAGSNIYLQGKFVSDGKFDPGAVDEQLGVIPVMKRIVEERPDLALPAPYPSGGVPPGPVPIGLHAAATLQGALNELGADPKLAVDGNYGRATRLAVIWFQQAAGLHVDGIAGPDTWAAIDAKTR